MNKDDDLEYCKVIAERDEARANYQWMVNHAADNKLDGYRELGKKTAEAEERAEQLKREKDIEVARLCQIIRSMLPEDIKLGHYSSDGSTLLDWQLCDSDGDPVEDDVIKSEMEELKTEIGRLNNKLNKDSQNFEIECLKATIEYKKEEIKFLQEKLNEACSKLLFSSQKSSR